MNKHAAWNHVKIAYYNDNNMKRYRQKSALFAIAKRLFQVNIQAR
jgi:hypothetical protein